jgi:hypothetical protein
MPPSPSPSPSPSLPRNSIARSFVQDLTFRAALVCSEQEATSSADAYVDSVSLNTSSGSGIKRKRAPQASSAPAQAGGTLSCESREKPLDLKGTHFRYGLCLTLILLLFASMRLYFFDSRS